jgi:hypothetical protein
MGGPPNHPPPLLLLLLLWQAGLCMAGKLQAPKLLLQYNYNILYYNIYTYRIYIYIALCDIAVRRTHRQLKPAVSQCQHTLRHLSRDTCRKQSQSQYSNEGQYSNWATVQQLGTRPSLGTSQQASQRSQEGAPRELELAKQPSTPQGRQNILMETLPQTPSRDACRQQWHNATNNKKNSNKS